ncbi:hypothetical protein BWR59_17160 [Pseudomonas sp. Bc-h]|uniref:DUF4411 family protein n=1 Tax=Pseudomonas sp. Bc-h TaxID=1943632 RepID=UPI0009DACEE4|nr:DUF4411 family protein [Pseudomonas sp. Bc-h]OQR30286.1 hypothetical protein BWR59_17160 [Pseudomonas sp. Bc-h]
MSYLLDANSYIQAKNAHYRMNFCPGFWDWLDTSFQSGHLSSISMVYKELAEYGDELSDWVKKRPAQFDAIDDKATQEFFGKIAQHVMEMALPNDPEKIRFLGGADPWLIAKAATTGKTIVTHEVLAPENSKKIKIPNICRDFNVSYITSFDLLDALEARLVIAPPAA